MNQQVMAALLKKQGFTDEQIALQLADAPVSDARQEYASAGAERDQLSSALSKMSSSAGALGGQQAEYLKPQDFAGVQKQREAFAAPQKPSIVQEYLMKKMAAQTPPKPVSYEQGKETSKSGKALVFNPQTGEYTEGPEVQVKPTISPIQEAKIAEQQNKVEESTYRKNILQQNAAKLKQLIKDYGTFELTGPQSESMDSLIYQMAVDYAKLVDPESVAREGEVAAAQKYMLPVKGLTVRNDTAVQLIDNYVRDLDARTLAREQAKKKNLPDYQMSNPGKAGEAYAEPVKQPAAVKKNYRTMSPEDLQREYEARKGR